MKNIDKITQIYEDEFLKADGFDEAIIGVDTNTFNSPPRIVYSVTKCIEIIAKDMSIEDAVDFFYYNTVGSFVGDKTPIWCEDELFINDEIKT